MLEERRSSKCDRFVNALKRFGLILLSEILEGPENGNTATSKTESIEARWKKKGGPQKEFSLRK